MATLFVSNLALAFEYHTTVKADQYNTYPISVDQALTDALMGIDLTFLGELEWEESKTEGLATALAGFVQDVLMRNPKVFNLEKKVRSCCLARCCPRFIRDYFERFMSQSATSLYAATLIEMLLRSKDSIKALKGNEKYSLKQKRKQFERLQFFAESNTGKWALRSTAVN